MGLIGIAYGQTIGYLRYDTVKIMKNGGRGSLDVTGAVKFTGLLQKSAGTDSVVVRDVNGYLGTVAKTALAGSPPLNTISAATATNSADHSNYAQTWAWNSLTANALTLSSTTTASSPGSTLLTLALSGANASSGRTTYALSVTNQHSGTTSVNYGLFSQATTGVTTYGGRFASSGTTNAYGVYSQANGAATNYAGFFNGSGGSTNYGIYVNEGLVNIQGLTASLPVFTDASKNLTNTGVVPLANGGTNSTDYRTATETFTNKRWTARVGSTTSSATPTINTDNYDIYKLTAQSAAITSFTSNLSGSPVDGDILEIQITDNGTARAITWGSSFVSTTVTLPTTTTISTTLTIIFQYYTTSSYGNNKWHCVNYY